MAEMNIEIIRNICNALPSVTEDIKWGNDLCFLIGRKMFCVVALDTPLKISLKVTDEEFGSMTEVQGVIPAPYAARNKWILIENASLLNHEQWNYYIKQSYNLVAAKLSKKLSKNDMNSL